MTSLWWFVLMGWDGARMIPCRPSSEKSHTHKNKEGTQALALSPCVQAVWAHAERRSNGILSCCFFWNCKSDFIVFFPQQEIFEEVNRALPRGWTRRQPSGPGGPESGCSSDSEACGSWAPLSSYFKGLLLPLRSNQVNKSIQKTPVRKAFMLYLRRNHGCADLDGDVSIKSLLGCLLFPRRVTCQEGLPWATLQETQPRQHEQYFRQRKRFEGKGPQMWSSGERKGKGGQGSCWLSEGWGQRT